MYNSYCENTYINALRIARYAMFVIATLCVERRIKNYNEFYLYIGAGNKILLLTYTNTKC